VPKGPGAGERLVPVTVAEVVTKAVPMELTTFGNVEAYSTVAVKPEVTGTLLAVHFQKGENVKKGQLLFEIDPRTFEAAVAQAEAAKTQAEAAKAQAEAAVGQARGTLARDQVQETNARRTLARQAELLQKHMAPQADYDKAQADADALAAAIQADEAAVRAGEAGVRANEAAVRADEAILKNARLQLERCTIHSPVDGKAGNVLVHEGNLVTTGADTALVTINQVSPIDVFFSIPQHELPAVKEHMAGGKLRVKALFPQDTGGPEVGELTFVDNAMDKSSGTIRLGATFENKNERLWPGQYVNVSLILALQNDAVVVPAKAVQAGREGKYVYAIRKDGQGYKVEMVNVTVGTISGDDVVILPEEKKPDGGAGLKVGDRVVTDGQFQLKKDSKVDIKREGAEDKRGPEKETPKEGGEKTTSGKKAAS
jgi:multidrug efflux system membrane fusion protein